MIACLPVLGAMEVNCYAWIDEETGHGFLIDPGAQGKDLAEHCRNQGWIIERILLTHGHFDHIGGIADFRKEFDVPVWIHREGEAYLTRPALNLSSVFGQEITVRDARYFRHGNLIALDARPSRALRVIHTPGHTPDSVLLYDEERGTAFSGDTVFRGAHGNDQLPGGDGVRLLQSIRRRVLTLPEETKLYPGHGEETSVGAEKPLYVPIN